MGKLRKFQQWSLEVLRYWYPYRDGSLIGRGCYPSRFTLSDTVGSWPSNRLAPVFICVGGRKLPRFLRAPNLGIGGGGLLGRDLGDMNFQEVSAKLSGIVVSLRVHRRSLERMVTWNRVLDSFSKVRSKRQEIRKVLVSVVIQVTNKAARSVF